MFAKSSICNFDRGGTDRRSGRSCERGEFGRIPAYFHSERYSCDSRISNLLYFERVLLASRSGPPFSAQAKRNLLERRLMQELVDSQRCGSRRNPISSSVNSRTDRGDLVLLRSHYFQTDHSFRRAASFNHSTTRCLLRSVIGYFS